MSQVHTVDVDPARPLPPEAALNRTLRHWLERPATRWTLVLAWAVLIFALSAQPAAQSSGLSGRIVIAIRDLSGGALPVGIDAVLETVVRKGAHMFEYAVLGALLVWAWRAWPARVSRSGGGETVGTGGPVGVPAGVSTGTVVWPFLLAVAHAVSDEVHQLFVQGRSGQLSDVLVDATGAALGVALATLWVRRRRAAPRP